MQSGSTKVIREYRAALALEDNAHTHKLLGLELLETGQWSDALNEFRLAERGCEPDELLPFRIAQAADTSGRQGEAAAEYRRFLGSYACTHSPANERCDTARLAVEKIKAESPR